MADTVKIEVERGSIPQGWKLVEAYEGPTQIIICGEPPEPENEEDYSHNCDYMGCSSLGPHVLYRFRKAK